MKYIKYIIVLTLFVSVVSCELANNVNPKEAETVPAEALFTNAQVALWNQVNNLDQNYNISRLLAQYNAQTTYYGESTWNFYDRSLPDRMWRVMYRDVLMDLKEARKRVQEDITIVDKEGYYALIDICEVYAFHVLVDVNGNIPYTGAVQQREDATPVYDDAATIYADLINRLTSASNILETHTVTFVNSDVLYGGNAESWRLFANSLKLRLAMRLADVNPTLSQTEAEAAISSGIFTNQTQSAKLYYFGITPHVNTINERMVQEGRRDFVAANTIVDTMNAVNDPRRAYYFTQIDTSSESGVVKLAYVGGRYGYRNVYDQCSSFPEHMREPGYPANILDYVEVEFLLAEAAARGYSVSGDVESHYNSAITESILDWGGTNIEAITYLAQPEIAYSMGTTASDFRAKIGLQKWIAMYDRGLEGWVSWRIFDSPTMNIAWNRTVDDIPVRMPYPYNEDNLNLENYEAASDAIGGDLVSTPIFWDRYDINGNLR